MLLRFVLSIPIACVAGLLFYGFKLRVRHQRFVRQIQAVLERDFSPRLR